MHLFVYGTLKDPAIIAAVTGRPWSDPQPALLRGYRLQGTSLGYPTIIAAPGAEAAGVLWPGVTADDLAYLDEYEDCNEPVPVYRRVRLDVEVAGGRLSAWVYVGNPDFFAPWLRRAKPDRQRSG